MRTRRLVLPLVFLLAAAPVSAQEPVSVAVLDFNAFSLTLEDAEAVGKGMAGMLMTELNGRNGLRVVERQQMRQLLQEQQLALSGHVDTGTALEVGRLLGVRYMITGNVALADRTRLDVRIFNVETGEIERTEKLTGEQDEFLDLVVRIADRFARDLELEVPDRADAEQEVPVQAMLAYSRGLAYEDAGDREQAAAMYRRALELFPDYRAATEALDRVSH